MSAEVPDQEFVIVLNFFLLFRFFYSHIHFNLMFFFMFWEKKKNISDTVVYSDKPLSTVKF